MLNPVALGTLRCQMDYQQMLLLGAFNPQILSSSQSNTTRLKSPLLGLPQETAARMVCKLKNMRSFSATWLPAVRTTGHLNKLRMCTQTLHQNSRFSSVRRATSAMSRLQSQSDHSLNRMCKYFCIFTGLYNIAPNIRGHYLGTQCRLAGHLWIWVSRPRRPVLNWDTTTSDCPTITGHLQ